MTLRTRAIHCPSCCLLSTENDLLIDCEGQCVENKYWEVRATHGWTWQNEVTCRACVMMRQMRIHPKWTTLKRMLRIQALSQKELEFPTPNVLSNLMQILLSHLEQKKKSSLTQVALILNDTYGEWCVKINPPFQHSPKAYALHLDANVSKTAWPIYLSSAPFMVEKMLQDFAERLTWYQEGHFPLTCASQSCQQQICARCLTDLRQCSSSYCSVCYHRFCLECDPWFLRIVDKKRAVCADVWNPAHNTSSKGRENLVRAWTKMMSGLSQVAETVCRVIVEYILI